MSHKTLSACHTHQQLAGYMSQHGAHKVRQSGSHEIWKAPSGQQIIICNHPGDIPRGTLSSIIKMILVAGMGILVAACAIIANLPLVTP